MTDPPGLDVAITYNGSTEIPTESSENDREIDRNSAHRHLQFRVDGDLLGLVRQRRCRSRFSGDVWHRSVIGAASNRVAECGGIDSLEKVPARMTAESGKPGGILSPELQWFFYFIPLPSNSIRFLPLVSICLHLFSNQACFSLKTRN